MHTLDIAPLRGESSPQNRSGMARRVLKGFRSFTGTPPHVRPQSELKSAQRDAKPARWL